MNTLDFLIAAVILLGLVKGLMCGFFRQVVSIAGFIVGLLVACALYAALGDKIAPHIGSGIFAGRALAFIVLWIGVPIGLSFLAHLLTKAVETVHLGWLNRLGGALLCGLKYAVFLSCLLNVAFRVHLVSAAAGEDSLLYHPVRTMSDKLFDVGKARVERAVERASSLDGGECRKDGMRPREAACGTFLPLAINEGNGSDK